MVAAAAVAVVAVVAVVVVAEAAEAAVVVVAHLAVPLVAMCGQYLVRSVQMLQLRPEWKGSYKSYESYNASQCKKLPKAIYLCMAYDVGTHHRCMALHAVE